ncbi:MAG: GntR family transcriptional regulator, partial [Limisphaerales bacterium]
MNSSLLPDPSERTAAKLASAIYEDIRQRQLKPGERYLNGPEIARKYGVTLITANRALHSLAERNILERRRRAGTFISELFVPSHGQGLRCIHLLMPLTYFRFARQGVEEALFGISHEMPEVNIQHTFLPV